MSETSKNEIDLIGLDDRSTQKVLREVDTALLANALKDAPDALAQQILRNMSKRAAALLKEEIAVLKPDDGAARKTAVDRINGIIEKLLERGEIIRGKEAVAATRTPKSPSIDAKLVGSIRADIVAMADKSRDEGLLSLENEIDAQKGDFLAQALQFIIDGTDPGLVRIFIERKIESYEQLERLKIKEEIYRLERALSEGLTRRKMILEGVLSIQRGDNNTILTEILDSF